MDYTQAGVRYDLLDPFKRLCQASAKKTAGELKRFKFREVAESRGEPAYLIELVDHYLALVEEGLGTKNLVADEVRKYTGKSHYDAIARDTVSAIVNDLCCLGAAPLSVSAHVAAGEAEWFADEERAADFARGWAQACKDSGATWGGGESPVLKEIISPGRAVLSGCAVGWVRPKKQVMLASKIKAGDAILILASSGIHTNGLTLARRIAETLPQGYATPLADGKSYGEHLLAPSILYPMAIQAMQKAGLDPHYSVPVSGHGWRKLMRAPKPFTYVVERLPDVHPVFHFLQQHAGLDDQEMYGTFNMGCGMAVYLPRKDAEKAVKVLARLKLGAFIGGAVERGPKRVVLKPLNIEYAADALAIR